MAEGGDILNILDGLFNVNDDTNSSESNSDDEEFLARDQHHIETRNQTDSMPWIYSPRSLQSWSAVQIVKQESLALLQLGMVPHALFLPLLREAIRVKSGHYLQELVARWPYEELDLRQMELPDWPKQLSQRTGSCVDALVCGLLNLQPQSPVRVVHLPHMQYKPALMTRKISQLPLFALPDISYDTVREYLDEGILKAPEFERYLSMVALPSHSFTNSSCVEVRGNLHVEGLSMLCNTGDVLLGLAMQQHSPYTFTWHHITINNMNDINILSKILGLISHPQKVESVIFSCDSHPDGLHIFYKLTCLASVMKKLCNLQNFKTDFRGLYVMTLQPHFNNQAALLQTSMLFTQWLHLQVLDLSGNQLTGYLGSLVACLQNPLRELHLSACMLTGADMESLGDSIHVLQLEVLTLDNNKLEDMIRATVTVLGHLQAIVKLSMAGCGLSVASGLQLVRAIAPSITLTSLDISQNSFHTLHELRDLLVASRQCTSLRQVLCKPYELHTIFAGLYIQAGGPRHRLSSSEETSLHELARELHLSIY